MWKKFRSNKSVERTVGRGELKVPGTFSRQQGRGIAAKSLSDEGLSVPIGGHQEFLTLYVPTGRLA